MTQSLMVSATGVHQSAVFKLLPSAFHRACIHFACGLIVSLGANLTHLPVFFYAADTMAMQVRLACAWCPNGVKQPVPTTITRSCVLSSKWDTQQR